MDTSNKNYFNRWDLESNEAEISTEECSGEASKESGGERSSYYRETKFSTLWYDNTSFDRQCCQMPIS